MNLLAPMVQLMWMMNEQLKSIKVNTPQIRLKYRKSLGGKWLTTDFKAGDLLLFTMHTMHCSLDNNSPDNRIRLSVDTRYQPADEPVDERWMGQNPVAHGDQAKRNSG